jgi:hypothetical protein
MAGNISGLIADFFPSEELVRDPDITGTEYRLARMIYATRLSRKRLL